MKIVFEITTEKLRSLLSKSATAQASTVQAEAFLTLYSQQLQDTLDERVREFVQHKLSAR